MAEASKFYCQKCSRATLYIGQKPKFCANCGLNFINGMPASTLKGTSIAQVTSDSVELISDASETASSIEIDDTPVQELPVEIEEVIEKPPKAKKRGRPKKEKEPTDISWFTKSAGTLRPNFRKH